LSPSGPRGRSPVSCPSARAWTPENLTAGYADGVLHLIIPVSPKTRARRVEITHAPGGSRTISGSTAEQAGAPAGGTGGG